MDFSPISTVLNDSFLLRTLLFQADYDTILNYCRSHLQAQEICRDKVFWIQKAQKEFNISPNNFRNTTLSPAQRYLELLTQNDGIAYGSEQFISLDKFVKRAIRQNRNDLVEYAINLEFNNWQIPLKEYA